MNTHTTQISNVLISGSGGAGLRAAIEAKQQGITIRYKGDVQWSRFGQESKSSL